MIKFRNPLAARFVAKPHDLPWAALGLGLLTTGLFCQLQRQNKITERDIVQNHLLQDRAAAIQSKLATIQAILDSTSGLFTASKAVNLEEFATFYQSLHLRNDTLKGVQGVGFAAVVPNNNIPAFEATIRRGGLPTFHVHPAGKRPLTTAIVYLQPDDWRNQRAKGYDMYSETTRREAMRTSASTGSTTLSGPVRLLQETDVKPQVGALIYTPIYRTPEISFTTSEQRLKHLEGWAYSPLRISDFLESAFSKINNSHLHEAHFRVYDGDQQAEAKLLYSSEKTNPTALSGKPLQRKIELAGRTWLLVADLHNQNLEVNGITPNLILSALLGMSLSSIAAIATRMLVNNHIALQESLEKEQEAARQQALASTVFNSSPVGIVVTDPSGNILRVNESFTRLSGYSSLEAVGHKANLLKSGEHDDAFYRDMWHAIKGQGHWNGEIWNKHRDGQIRRHELNITAVRDEQRKILNFVGLLRDITDRHNQEKRMRHLATHDQLTGLPNRLLLMDRLKRSLVQARRQRKRVGLLFIDLNGFKPVNDQHGHHVGDQLLQQVGERLLNNLRASDTLCRQGGDEFVLLVPDAASLEQLHNLAHKLQACLQEPFADLPDTIRISASIGIARWPDHAETADGLLAMADNAMYAAKQGGGSHIALADAPSS